MDNFAPSPLYYVEFRGPGFCDEVGTVVSAANPDDAITRARAEILEALSDPAHRPGSLAQLHPSSFIAWRLAAVRLQEPE